MVIDFAGAQARKPAARDAAKELQEPPIYRRRVDFYTKSRAFDITRARQEIGYAPRVGLRDGITRTLDWYAARGWL